MAKDSSFPELKRDIKNNSLKSLYLFFGEETYLRDLYTQKLLNMIDDAGFEDLNKVVIENGRDLIPQLPEYLEGFPMMTDKRIVCIRDSGIFKKADEQTKKYFTEFFKNLSDDTITLFVEDEVDKKTSLYKSAKKYGLAVEFEKLGAVDMVTWLIREANGMGLKISKQNAEYMLSICDNTLGTLENELKKLSGYCSGEILKTDIERVVSKSLQIRVFELCDCMMEKNADGAITILEEMKTVKESAFKLIYILFGTFDKMLHAKLMLKSGSSNGEIASALKLPPFIAGKYTAGASKFTVDELMRMTAGAAEADLSIKRGAADEWAALEKYVYMYFVKK